MANQNSYLVVVTTKQTYTPGMGVDSEEQRTIHTKAVSSRQAISNVKRQYGLKSADLVIHGQSGYCRRISFSAERLT